VTLGELRSSGDKPVAAAQSFPRLIQWWRLSMQVHNRDVFPTQDIQQLYGPIEPIVTNELVDRPFSAHETEATRMKRQYHRRGRIALLLVLLSAMFTLAEALILPDFYGDHLVSILFVICAVIGLVIQIHLIWKKKKQSWLLHRFAAERLRSIKFQAYPLALHASSTPDLQTRVNAFYTAEVARLQMELNAGYSVLSRFSPRKAVAKLPPPAASAPDPQIISAAQNAYRELRLNYQIRFATGEIQLLQEKQRIGYTSSDVLYLFGAGLTAAALACKVLSPSAANVSDWIDFSAVTAFMLSLFKAILDNASLAETSKARYEDYVRALEDSDAELIPADGGFSEQVRRIERVALEELAHFCQAGSQISYRL
jgi:hypothetical protein